MSDIHLIKMDLKNRQLWVEASPLTYISLKAPPLLFINSSIDRFNVGRDEAINILSESNIYYKVHTISKTSYSF